MKCQRESQADIVNGRPELNLPSLGRRQEELHSGNSNRRNPGNTAVIGHVSGIVKGSQLRAA